MNYSNDLKELNKFSRNNLYNKVDLTLTSSKLEILGIISSTKNISATKLASDTAMKKEAVSRAIKELLNDELITKTYDSNDRRISYLNITEKGEEILKENYESLLKPLKNIKEVLGEDYDNFILSIMMINEVM